MNEQIINELGAISLLSSNLPPLKKQCDFSVPPLFIIGCPRSGTTAVGQYLASTGAFGYPTNLLARFAENPYVGSIVNELVYNPEFGLEKEKVINFQSEFGRSDGGNNFNEFYHFWRRFFPNEDIRWLTDEELSHVKVSELLNEIAAMSCVLGKPFLSKAMMCQYNLEHFYHALSPAVFLYIKRDPIFVMQSIYQARIKEMGGEKAWWSAKPKEYQDLLNHSVSEQIAGQVYYTELAIERAQTGDSGKRIVTFTYEEFIANPDSLFDQLAELYRLAGYELKSRCAYENSFMSKNVATITETVSSQLLSSYNDLKCG